MTITLSYGALFLLLGAAFAIGLFGSPYLLRQDDSDKLPHPQPTIGQLAQTSPEPQKRWRAGDAIYGVASWYSYGWIEREDGERIAKRCADGSAFNPDAYTCASWAWPIGTRLKIENEETHAYVIVTVTDRGPKESLHRLVDLTPAAFKQIADLDDGICDVIASPIK